MVKIARGRYVKQDDPLMRCKCGNWTRNHYKCTECWSALVERFDVDIYLMLLEGMVRDDPQTGDQTY